MNKNILKGFLLGVIATVCLFLIIGDVDIKADFQFGEKSNRENKDITISIEKSFNENNEESIIIDVIGKGSASIEDIENALEKVFLKNDIDASSGIEVNITLDSEIDIK
jgi:hypothetical protein